MVDDFSKFVLLQPFENIQSETVARYVERNVVWMFGKPAQLRTDGGPEFKGAFDEMCRAYDIHHAVTSPHAPWRNGRAERMVRTTKSLIRRMLQDEPEREWPALLP